MSRILVTGGAGFIGSNLVDALLEDGHQVTAVDSFDDFYARSVKESNLTDAKTHRAFRLAELDIRDAAALADCWQKAKPEVVVHLAARAGVRLSLERPELYWDVNCNGTLNLLQLACRHELPKFVFASSSSVYGDSDVVPFREDFAADQPISPYAASKRAAEMLCHTFWHLYGLNIFCLRFFTVYGPRNRPDLAVAKFTRRIDAGQPIKMFGDGTTSRDYTFVDDTIDGVKRAIERCHGFAIYNLGNSSPVTLKDLIAAIENALGKQAEIVSAALQPGDVTITYADISKAQAELGYNPKTPFNTGIARTWNGTGNDGSAKHLTPGRRTSKPTSISLRRPHRRPAGQRGTGVSPVIPRGDNGIPNLQSPIDMAEFTCPDTGQTVHYMLKCLSTRGEAGPWSETASATIGA